MRWVVQTVFLSAAVVVVGFYALAFFSGVADSAGCGGNSRWMRPLLNPKVNALAPVIEFDDPDERRIDAALFPEVRVAEIIE